MHEEEPIRSYAIINHQLTTVNTVLCLGTPGGRPDRADCRRAPVCIHKQYSGNYNFGTFYVSHTPVVHQPLCQPRTRHPQMSHLYSLHWGPKAGSSHCHYTAKESWISLESLPCSFFSSDSGSHVPLHCDFVMSS